MGMAAHSAIHQRTAANRPIGSVVRGRAVARSEAGMVGSSALEGIADQGWRPAEPCAKTALETRSCPSLCAAAIACALHARALRTDMLLPLHEGTNEAARFHLGTRGRRGDAVCGTRPAAEAADHRLFVPDNRLGGARADRRFRAAIARARLDGGPRRSDRVPLGGGARRTCR